MESRTIYEHQLPPERDPEVAALASEWIRAARVAQRPARAVAYALPSTAIGVVLWGELNAWTRFQMHWYVMAGVTIALGFLLGRPSRKLGALFDARWGVVFGVLGLAMAVIGDLYAAVGILAGERGLGWTEVALGLTASEVREWLAARVPLDWVVSGFAAVGAGLGALPALDARQVRMQARIEVARRRLVEEEAGAEAEAEAAEESSAA